MAAVKTIGGSVVNTAGVPLPSKTATLKNDDTNATITTTTTNADGEWEFANRDETIRYRVEAAFGGSSSQVVVRKPASAEFDHLYANLSFRTAPAATVALGGALTVAGTVTAGALWGTGPSSITSTLVVGAAASAPVGELTVKGAGSANADLSLIEGDTNNGWVLGAVVSDDHFSLSRFVSPSTYTEQLSISAAGAVAIPGTLTVSGTAALVSTGITGPLTVSGTTTLNNVVNIAGALSASARILVDGGSLATPEVACISDPDTGIVFEGSNVMALVSGGVTLLDVRPTGLEAPRRILVDGGALATPEIACISDPDTGIVWNGADQLVLAAGGNEVARAWMNGANSQFGTYGAETYIGTNKLMLSAAILTTATSATGVIRKIQVCDSTGAPVGWLAVYGAVG